MFTTIVHWYEIIIFCIVIYLHPPFLLYSFSDSMCFNSNALVRSCSKVVKSLLGLQTNSSHSSIKYLRMDTPSSIFFMADSSGFRPIPSIFPRADSWSALSSTIRLLRFQMFVSVPHSSRGQVITFWPVFSGRGKDKVQFFPESWSIFWEKLTKPSETYKSPISAIFK